MGLKCLGSFIEESRTNPIIIQVDSIRNRTVPTRINDTTRLRVTSSLEESEGIPSKLEL